MHLVNLAESKVFRSTIFFMIILNCMLLAMDSPPRVGQERVVLDLIQLPIYSSFIFEMIVLLIGSGPSTYWQDPWNRMDLLIVVGSIIDRQEVVFCNEELFQAAAQHSFLQFICG